jgi:Gluconate 2-dehydrogenase subunit 3
MTENSRRTFIKTVTVGVLGTEAIAGLHTHAFAKDETRSQGIEIQKGYKVFEPNTQKTMEALTEALIPGSGAFGINEKIFAYVNKDRAAATFFDAGLWNIDTISRQKFKKPFYELTNKEEILAIINHVSANNRRFFAQFRYLTMRLFYADPKVWKSLSYDGPPQPKGFLDYSEPPKAQK